jgi:hypothetical protein
MKLTVQCYSGRKADERPIRFCLEGRPYQIEAVLDQWYDPESVFYKVRRMTGISTFSATGHQAPMGPGIWFHFANRGRVH